jgi:hypothetical protein
MALTAATFQLFDDLCSELASDPALCSLCDDIPTRAWGLLAIG